MNYLTDMERKSVLRQELRTRRAALSAEEIDAYAVGFAKTGIALLDSLPLNTSRQAITGYLPVAAEPPVLALLEAFSSAGHQVFMPVCEPKRQLSWVLWHPGIELRTSNFAAIQEPVGERLGFEVFSAVGMMLLPALAVDGSGTRLGQGGGYYDRVLSRLRQGNPAHTPVFAAAVYSEDLLPAGSLPREALDQPVQCALTPEFFRQLEC